MPERARTAPTGLDRELLALLRADADGPVPPALPWEELRTIARERGAAPLLFHRLRHRSGVPSDALAALRGDYLAAAAESAHRDAWLGRLLRRLRAGGAEVLVLKGAWLAEAVYERPALRPMGDVDLLLRAADLDRARDLLLADGFRQRRLSPFESVVTGRHHLLPFSAGGAGAHKVELHFQLTPRHIGMLEPLGAWERSRPATVAGSPVRALCPEDLLTHVAVHACLQHRLAGGLPALLDADALLRAAGGALDWEGLERRARAEGSAPSVALLLALAAELLGTPGAAGAAKRLAPAGSAPGVRELALAQLFDDRGGGPFVPGTLARLAHAGGLRGAIRVLRRRVLTERGGGAEDHGRHLPLPLRLVDLACLLWVFHRPAARLIAGCTAERRSAARAMRGEALALALAPGTLR